MAAVCEGSACCPILQNDASGSVFLTRRSAIGLFSTHNHWLHAAAGILTILEQYTEDIKRLRLQ